MADERVFPGLDDWIEAWISALRQTPAADAQAEMAGRLLDPRNWLDVGGAALWQPFETILGLPRLADVPDRDRKLLGILQNWAAVTQNCSTGRPPSSMSASSRPSARRTSWRPNAASSTRC